MLLRYSLIGVICTAASFFVFSFRILEFDDGHTGWMWQRIALKLLHDNASDVPVPSLTSVQRHLYASHHRLAENKPNIKLSSLSLANETFSCDLNNVTSSRWLLERNKVEFRHVTCSAMLQAKPYTGVFRNARRLMTTHPLRKLEDEAFVERTKDCEAYKQRLGYHVNATSQNEADFPIAYNILTHKDVHQIEFLLRAIYRPQNAYCIHADAKQPKAFQTGIRAIAKCFDNVYIASKLESVVYAGFSRLQADINCMNDQVKHPIKWRYLINIAGQSFPLKTNEEIVNILRIYNGANDIEGICGWRILTRRFKYEWIEDFKSGTMVMTGRANPPPPHNIEIVRGSAYGIFSRKFVEFIVTDQKAKALLEWSRKTYSPDEHYWATLHHTYGNPHLHTPGAFAGKPNRKPWLAVYVGWLGFARCHGLWIRSTCVFGVADLPQLLPHHELFANKFYIDHEPLTLICLNEWLEYKVKCPMKEEDYDFYRQLPYVYKNENSSFRIT